MLSGCSVELHITISVLIGVIYTDFVADHLQLLIVSMFPGGYGLFPQNCEWETCNLFSDEFQILY